MKTSLITLAAIIISLSSFAADPSEVVLKNFNAAFSNPEKVTWHDGQDHYQASFVQSGIHTRVKYDKNGNFISAVRYYGEENLPIYLLNQLKKNYASKTIHGVTEVTHGQDVNYYVSLYDEKTITVLQLMVNGEVVSAKKYKKG